MNEAAPGTRLSGQGALVTGAVRGVGAAIARRFAAEGARTLVHGLELGPAEELVGSIRASGGDAAAVAGDLADPTVPERLAAQAIEILGHVDILVNNAALTTRSNLATTGADLFDEIMAVNVRAPLLLIRALFHHFRDIGGATVLNIGSVNAYCGERDLLAYSISKGALTTMSRNLADAHATEGIRVNHFNLGWVLTEREDELKRAEGFPAGWAEALPPSLAPSGSLQRPDEIAHFALAFVERSHRVNGAVVDLEQYPMIGHNPPKPPPA